LAASAPHPGENDAHEALTLLQRAYEQLSTRKQSIEAELARIDGLRGEHEAVTAQVAALDQAMKAFHQQSLRQPKIAALLHLRPMRIGNAQESSQIS
jgi:hypothetical protein